MPDTLFAATAIRTFSGPRAAMAEAMVAPVVTTSSTTITSGYGCDRTRNGCTGNRWSRPALRLLCTRGTSADTTGAPMRLLRCDAIIRAGSTPYLSLRVIARGTGTRGNEGTLVSRSSATSAANSPTPRYLRRCMSCRAAPSCSKGATSRMPPGSNLSAAGRSVAVHPGQSRPRVGLWQMGQIIPSLLAGGSDKNGALHTPEGSAYVPSCHPLR